MAKVKVTLWRQDTWIRYPVRSAAQHHDQRSRLFLAVEFQGVTGYGEVAPQPKELNGDAAIGDVIDEVKSPADGYVLSFPHHGNQAAASGDVVAFVAPPHATIH